MSLILCTDRITFRAKLDVFRLILIKKYPQFLADNPNFYKDLVHYTIEERNIMAHYLFDTSEGYIEKFNNGGKIGFVKFKVSSDNPAVKILEYDPPKINKILIEIGKYTMALVQFNSDNG
jgi:hypothetical protein